MNCPHTRTKRGKDAPRAWGSWRTQVCLDCGAFRMHAHNEDPDASPGWSKSAWRPAGEYNEATDEATDDAADDAADDATDEAAPATG